MSISLCCLAETQAQAESIVDGLRDGGFASDDVSVLFADSGAARDAFDAKYTTTFDGGMGIGLPASALAGGVPGGLAGGDALTVPGVGSFMVSGPLRTAFEADALGISGHGIAAALAGLGLPASQAHRCERLVCSGLVLVAAHADDSSRIAHATRIAANAGVLDCVTAHRARDPGAA
jgi:hypothetical protein